VGPYRRIVAFLLDLALKQSRADIKRDALGHISDDHHDISRKLVLLHDALPVVLVQVPLGRVNVFFACKLFVQQVQKLRRCHKDEFVYNRELLSALLELSCVAEQISDHRLDEIDKEEDVAFVKILALYEFIEV